jgi:hypothetical protein
MEIANINFIALAIAAMASFGLGAAWYSPFLFGKAWQKELGFTDEYLKKGNMLAIFGSSLLLIFLMDLGLAVILQGHAGREITALSGSLYGLLIGIFFVAASIGINILYQRKSFKLWAIDAGYQVLYLAMTGAILGNWR